MSEAIMIIAFAGLVLWMIAEDRRQQNDPLRPEMDALGGAVSASCDYSNHSDCGYPGRLFMSRSGCCECPCHRSAA